MVEMKGIYNRTSADNYEEFLTALGVSWPLRLMATNSAPKMEGEIVLNEFRDLKSTYLVQVKITLFPVGYRGCIKFSTLKVLLSHIEYKRPWKVLPFLNILR